jgi:hypothetical protein
MDSKQVTAIVSTSPIKNHPSTSFMDETIAGIRFHFPESPIIITADEVWNRLEHYRPAYEEYLKRIDNRYDSNVRIIKFPVRTHQTAMTQYAIQNFVKTDLIWVNEHDLPLRTDRYINWDAIIEAIRKGDANHIHLSIFEEGIHPAHEHLMTGRWRIEGCTFVRTVQYSHFPHMSTVKFYVEKIFSGQPIGLEMVELRMYGLCANAPWEEYKLVVYHPDGPAQRFKHINGRAGDPCSWE